MATSQTLEVIERRYACRAFSDTPIPDDVLDAIITAALHSPSAVNRQPWQLIIVRDKALVQEIERLGFEHIKEADPAGYDRLIGRGGTMLYHAPVVFIVAGEAVSVAQYADVDCGIVASHVALAAASLGVDSCIAAMPRVAFTGESGKALGQRIGMADDHHFTISVLLGYASGDAKPGHDINPAKASIV